MKPFRLLVCGGRDFNDVDKVSIAILAILDDHALGRPDVVIVHGAARGADEIGGRIGRTLLGGDEPYPADWVGNGRAAGHVRNELMASTRPDYALVFPGGRGTEDMANRLLRHRIPFRFVP